MAVPNNSKTANCRQILIRKLICRLDRAQFKALEKFKIIGENPAGSCAYRDLQNPSAIWQAEPLFS
jgi:hypothetical protein